MSVETPFFFSGINKKLFGVYHQATKSSLEDEKSIICCHSLFGEKIHSHRILVNFARYAAKRNINVLRFDLEGNGESDGSFEDVGIDSWIDDINSAIRLLKQKNKNMHIYVLGIRFGASLALKYIQHNKTLKGGIAWSPIFDVESHLTNLLRSNLVEQMVVHKNVLSTRKELITAINKNEYVNIEGYSLGNPFWSQAVNINFLKKDTNYNSPILLCQISPSKVLQKEYIEFLKHFKPMSYLKTELFVERKFWMPQNKIYPSCEDLFCKTIDWVSQHKSHDKVVI